MPHDIVFSNKSSEKGGKRDDINCYDTCLPKQPLCVLRPRFPQSVLTSACQWEAVNEFLFPLLVCMAFGFLIKLSFS